MEIKFKKIKYSYDDNEFINIDELYFNSNKITNIIGKNASGKSTLSKILSGLEEIEDMKIYVDGEEIEHSELKAGVVFQNPDFQFVSSIVRDDIAFGLENMGLKRMNIIDRVEKYSKLFNVENLLDSEIKNLSGGQKQKIAILNNLILNPKLLILDEVFEMLDSENKIEIINLIKEYQREHEVCIINITHDENIIDEFDNIIILEKGKVIKEIKVKDFFLDQNLLEEFKIKRPFKYDIMEQLEINEKEYEEQFES